MYGSSKRRSLRPPSESPKGKLGGAPLPSPISAGRRGPAKFCGLSPARFCIYALLAVAHTLLVLVVGMNMGRGAAKPATIRPRC